MPKISIITPTQNREAFLPAIWRCVQDQTIQDIEWLVHDGSPQRSIALGSVSDPRLRYFYDPQPMTIGAKRNVLVGLAQGDTIIHMDDDDYYAPAYIEAMLSLMVQSNVDIVKLFGFYLYHQASARFAYWDLEHAFPFHYLLHPQLTDTPVGPRMVGAREPWGYGFSYVYHRRVWEKHNFPNQGHGEDQVFADAAIADFRHAGMQDRQQLAVHVIHTTNTSMSFPQQLLLADAAKRISCADGMDQLYRDAFGVGGMQHDLAGKDMDEESREMATSILPGLTEKMASMAKDTGTICASELGGTSRLACQDSIRTYKNEAMAAGADAGFNADPSVISGRVAIARKTALEICSSGQGASKNRPADDTEPSGQMAAARFEGVAIAKEDSWIEHIQGGDLLHVKGDTAARIHELLVNSQRAIIRNVKGEDGTRGLTLETISDPNNGWRCVRIVDANAGADIDRAPMCSRLLH